MSIPRLVLGVRGDRALTLDEHIEVHGPLRHAGPELIDDVRASGLTGRGGASFPSAVKLASVAAQRGPRAVLANGAEGEPMSGKDCTLMELAPHLVLDGALAAAAAVRADTVVVSVPADAELAWGSLRGAAAERLDARRVRIVRVPAAYLTGEESALIRHLDGGPLKPTLAPPRPFERGLGRRPTLVHNVETLAHIALIARHGPSWFREIGTVAQPGSLLVTVSGAVHRPHVYEIGYGEALGRVLSAAGGATEPLRAVLVGGYHGTWLPGEGTGTLALHDEGLAGHGASLAAGVIVALGGSACPVREVSRVMDWLAEESAGQCGPCSHGLPAIADLVAAVADGAAPADAQAALRRWGGQLPRRGACSLPDGAVRFLASAMREFAVEFEEHRRLGPCRTCRRAGTLAVPRGERVAA